jgi:AcrR family transcriptional regulator
MTTQAQQRGRPRSGTSSAEAPPRSQGRGGEATTQAAPRGRPRSEKAHKAILDAAVELLLARGLSAVSMDAVAERAGVSKATIYRWWPTKETLALDALYTEWAAASPHPRDTGSLRGDLLALLRPWAGLASSRPYGRVIAALITEAQTDPVFAAEYRQRVVEPRRDQARAVFRRAIERGEIPADTKIEVALDLLYGPLYHRLLHGHAPLTDRFTQDVIDMALSGIQPPQTQQQHRPISLGGGKRRAAET